MDQFIASRERNAVSALYLVEEEPKPERPLNGMTMFQRALEEDLPVSFVTNPTRIWASALGSQMTRGKNGGEFGFKTRQYLGLQIGLIKEDGDRYLGLTGGYTRTTNRWEELQSKDTSDNYMFEALLGFRRGMGFLEFSANAGYMDHKMVRNIELGRDMNDGEYNAALDCDLDDNYYNGVYRTVHTGNYYNRIFGAGLRFGYQKVLYEKWLFLPTLAFYFQDVRNPEHFSEDGREIAAFRLEFDKDHIKKQSLRVPLMLRLSRGIAFGEDNPWVLTPEIRGGVTAELLDRGGLATYKWRGNPIANRYMIAHGLEEDRLFYQAGATIEISRRGRFYAAANYDCTLQSKTVGHNFSLQMGLNF